MQNWLWKKEVMPDNCIYLRIQIVSLPGWKKETKVMIRNFWNIRKITNHSISRNLKNSVAGFTRVCVTM